jgi:hypothetical protein
MAKKIILLLIVTFIIGLLLTYFNRGGLVKPTLTKVQTQPFFMASTTYKGFGKDKNLRNIIRQTHEYLEKGVLKGSLAIIYYGNPDTYKDSIDIVVGVMIQDTAQMKLPENYQIRQVPAMRVVRAELKAHVSVAPNPAKINEMLIDFARKSGLQPDHIHIEKYFSEEHIISEIGVK